MLKLLVTKKDVRQLVQSLGDDFGVPYVLLNEGRILIPDRRERPLAIIYKDRPVDVEHMAYYELDNKTQAELLNAIAELRVGTELLDIRMRTRYLKEESSTQQVATHQEANPLNSIILGNYLNRLKACSSSEAKLTTTITNGDVERHVVQLNNNQCEMIVLAKSDDRTIVLQYQQGPKVKERITLSPDATESSVSQDDVMKAVADTLNKHRGADNINNMEVSENE